MKKELQDLAWSVLPKGFKETVKNRYKNALHFNEYAHECVVLRDLFGEHNLTSDEEEEEMLTVKAKVVRDMYAANERLADFPDNETVLISNHINHVLRQLFGSKCVPDEEDTNVLEPNCAHFSDGKCAHPAAYHLKNGKLVKGADCDVSSCEDVEYVSKGAPLSQNPAENCDNVHIYDFGKQLNDIIRDRSRHNRLLIAAMAMQGILTPTTMGIGGQPSPEVAAKIALKYADALMGAADKGGEQ